MAPARSRQPQNCWGSLGPRSKPQRLRWKVNRSPQAGSVTFKMKTGASPALGTKKRLLEAVLIVRIPRLRREQKGLPRAVPRPEPAGTSSS